MLILTPLVRGDAPDTIRRDMIEKRGEIDAYTAAALTMRYGGYLREPAVITSGGRPWTQGGRSPGGGRGGGGSPGWIHRPPRRPRF